MPRQYMPQKFHGDVQYSTNYAPQSNDEGGGAPTTGHMLYESGGDMQYESNSAFMLYEET